MAHPSVLFVLSDQFRAMCLEDDPVRTPHLDRFADRGAAAPGRELLPRMQPAPGHAR